MQHQHRLVEHNARDVRQVQLLRIRNRKPLKSPELIGCVREVIRVALKRDLAKNAEKEPRIESPRKTGRGECAVEVNESFGAWNQA